MNNLIKIEGISKFFKGDFWTKPFCALKDVSFVVPEAKAVGFLGANGAGKTTAIKIILGLINPTKGSVQFSSSLGANKLAAMKSLGHFPERPYFYPYLSAREFIIYMGLLNDISRIELSQKIPVLAERLGIDHALDRKIRTFSKGMLQRLGIIVALIHDPKILILDEPLAGMDPVGRKDIKDLMLDIKKQGKTIFFSSHIVSDIEEVCENVVVLEKGRVFYEGSIENLLQGFSAKKVEIISSLNDETIVSKVDIEQLQNSLSSKIANGESIIKVTPERATLEEIIYNVGNT